MSSRVLNAIIDECTQCPYGKLVEEGQSYYSYWKCLHKNAPPYNDQGSGHIIPDWCPLPEKQTNGEQI